jgi:hypothetical protein
MITLGCALGVQLAPRLKAEEDPKKTIRASQPGVGVTKGASPQVTLTEAQRQQLQTEADRVGVLQTELQALENNLAAQQEKHRVATENLAAAKAQFQADYQKLTGGSLDASQWKLSSGAAALPLTASAVTGTGGKSYDDESPKKAVVVSDLPGKKFSDESPKELTSRGTMPGARKAAVTPKYDDESPKDVALIQQKLPMITGGVTSASDAGLRDPSAFPRPAGLVRKDFSSNSDPSRLNETANYSTASDFDAIVENSTQTATAAGWKEMSRSEKGASPKDRTTMILWERGNVKVDQRFYATPDGNTVYLQVSTDRTQPATP